MSQLQNSRELLIERFKKLGTTIQRAEKASTSPDQEPDDCYKDLLGYVNTEIVQASKEGPSGLRRLKSLHSMLSCVFGVEKAVVAFFEETSPGSEMSIPVVHSPYETPPTPPQAFATESRQADSFAVNGTDKPKSGINAASGKVYGGPSLLPPQSTSQATAFSVNKAAAEAILEHKNFWDRKDVTTLAQPPKKKLGEPVFIPAAQETHDNHPISRLRQQNQKQTDRESQVIKLW